MHSHYTLTNQRAKDSVLAVAQPIVHGIRIQHREISISKDFPTMLMFHCYGVLSKNPDRRIDTLLISCGFKDRQASYLG